MSIKEMVVITAVIYTTTIAVFLLAMVVIYPTIHIRRK